MHPPSSPTVTLYGIPNCSSVKKARVYLEERGIDYQFHDFKKDGLSPTLLDSWLARIDWQTLLNRKGTTWRTLDAATQLAAANPAFARTLMLEKPTLIKRPVIDWSHSLTVGFDAERFSSCHS